MKSVKILSLTLAIALLVVGCVHGKGGLVESKPQTTCPVMRGRMIKCTIDKEVYTDYKGKLVYFCYKDCIAEFWEDPEKYIKILEGEGVTLEEATSAKTKNETSHADE